MKKYGSKLNKKRIEKLSDLPKNQQKVLIMQNEKAEVPLESLPRDEKGNVILYWFYPSDNDPNLPEVKRLLGINVKSCIRCSK